MNRLQQTVKIPASVAEKYTALLEQDAVDYGENNFPRYALLCRWTANFGNGYEMDFKVCSSDENDPIWCEAVLFRNGSEIACSEVLDELIGTVELEADGQVFELTVAVDKEET